MKCLSPAHFLSLFISDFRFQCHFPYNKWIKNVFLFISSRQLNQFFSKQLRIKFQNNYAIYYINIFSIDIWSIGSKYIKRSLIKEKLQEKFRLWVNLNILNVKDISYNKIKLFLMNCNGLQWIIFVKLEINFGKIDIFIH